MGVVNDDGKSVWQPRSVLPVDAKERKAIPVYSGFMMYFPDAIVEVAKVSQRGNDQHNPGQPLHWDRTKSTDESDAMARHFLEDFPDTSEGLEAASQTAWRAMARLQKKIERMKNAGK